MPTFNTNNHDPLHDKESWLTPKWLIDFLGPFDLDPCTIPTRPFDTASHHLTKQDDGLSVDWTPYAHIWLNPPYGNKTFTWLDRLSRHSGTGYALIFARTETKGFFAQVWDKATAIFFFRGRIRFLKPDGNQRHNANAPSCIVTYNQSCVEKLQQLERIGKGICIILRPNSPTNSTQQLRINMPL